MELMTPPEVRARLRVSDSTLHRWRHDGIGPPWMRLGGDLGAVRYEREGFEKWFEAQRRQPVAAEG